MTIDGMDICRAANNGVKTGVLMICPGSTSRFLPQIAPSTRCEGCRLLSDKQRSTGSVFGKNSKIRDEADSTSQSFDKKDLLKHVLQKTAFSHATSSCADCEREKPNKSVEGNGISKPVKVCVCANTPSPYIVIYDSQSKFASPNLNLTLKKSRIVSSTTIDEELRFRIYPNMSGDVIVFQAATKAKRDEWVNFLTPLTQTKVSPFGLRKMRRNLPKISLASLEEAEEPGEALQSVPMKAPSRRYKSREGRRSSLTLTGLRPSRRPIMCPSA